MMGRIQEDMMLKLLKKMVSYYVRCLWFFILRSFYFCSLWFICVNFVESPFEFRALEVVLDSICSFLAARTLELEGDIYTALDQLALKVSAILIFLFDK